MPTPRRNTDKHNYQVVTQHEGDRAPQRHSFASPDTAWGRAAAAFEAGAEVAQVIRKTDGALIYDGPAGVAPDYRTW